MGASGGGCVQRGEEGGVREWWGPVQGELTRLRQECDQLAEGRSFYVAEAQRLAAEIERLRTELFDLRSDWIEAMRQKRETARDHDAEVNALRERLRGYEAAKDECRGA